MTALAIYDDQYLTLPNIHFPDLAAILWSFLIVAFSSITGIFMAEKDDDLEDEDIEDYLSDEERAALDEDEDEDPDNEGDETGDDDLDNPDKDDSPDKKDGADTGSDPDNNDNGEDDPDKDKDSEGKDKDGAQLEPDPKDNKDKDKKEDKQELPADSGKPGTGGDVKETPSFEDRRKDLEKEFDDGKIEFDDYKKKLRAIDIEETREVTRQEVLKTQAEITWKEEQRVFFSSNPDMSKEKANPIIFSAFANEVGRLAQDPKWKDKSGLELLNAARDNVKDAFGFKQEKKDPEPKKKTDGEKAVDDAKKSQAEKNAPKSLKDVPASDKNTDNPFDYIDKLEGAAYEKAIANLSEAELEAYENSH